MESVKAQRWDAIEHIVVDGGSTDTTLEILHKHDSDIAYWCSEPDDGIYAAMNKGLDLAMGEYVLFLNSGDVLQGRVLSASQDFSRLLPVVTRDFWGRPRFLRLRDLRLGMPYCHQGILFKNEQLTRFQTRYRIAGDYEFLLSNLSRAGLNPPSGADRGFVVFDATGVSNTRVRERDIEAGQIVRRHFGVYHWMRFWSLQGPKLLVRWLRGTRGRR